MKNCHLWCALYVMTQWPAPSYWGTLLPREVILRDTLLPSSFNVPGHPHSMYQAILTQCTRPSSFNVPGHPHSMYQAIPIQCTSTRYLPREVILRDTLCNDPMTCTLYVMTQWPGPPCVHMDRTVYTYMDRTVYTPCVQTLSCSCHPRNRCQIQQIFFNLKIWGIPQFLRETFLAKSCVMSYCRCKCYFGMWVQSLHEIVLEKH